MRRATGCSALPGASCSVLLYLIVSAVAAGINVYDFVYGLKVVFEEVVISCLHKHRWCGCGPAPGVETIKPSGRMQNSHWLKTQTTSGLQMAEFNQRKGAQWLPPEPHVLC